jgi:hypothetical protein
MCGLYRDLSYVASKALKWNPSYATISATQSIGKNQPIENRTRDLFEACFKACQFFQTAAEDFAEKLEEP